jgi:methylated-DNA-[protein]-cysteine S-methyltransferase
MTDKNLDRDVTELLGRIPPPTDAELVTLHARLAERADDTGVLDIAYRTLDSPVGTLLVAATSTGLLRVAYEREGLNSVLEVLAMKLSPRILAAPARLDAVARQLEEYFDHRREQFELPLDLSLASGFRRQVLAYLPAIEYGHTSSYAAVAAAVRSPGAVRAVGSACASNPLPLVIPCHRVVRSDGGIGGYLGGSEVKRQLLELEAAA